MPTLAEFVVIVVMLGQPASEIKGFTDRVKCEAAAQALNGSRVETREDRCPGFTMCSSKSQSVTTAARCVEK